MKSKVKYKKYGNIPDMNTVKEIILRGAKLGQDKKQYVFKNLEGNTQTKTFNEVFYDATGLGQHLYTLGMRGKKVAILSDNSYYWIAAFYAIVTGKITAIPLDPKLPKEDLTDLMVRSGCNAIIYTEEFAPAIEMMKENPEVVLTEYLKIEDFDEIVRMGHNELDGGAENYLDDTVTGDDLGFIVYTSGTTGKSKGVMLSQKNVASNAIATCRAMTGGQTVAFLPFNHTLSWASALFASPLLSEWGCLCDSLRNLQKDMVEYHPQHITAVPLAVETIYKRIWFTAKKEGKEEKLKTGLKISKFLMKFGIDVRRKLFKEVIDNLGGNLEMIICGGAFLDPKYENGLFDLGIQVINGYGTTECSPIITCNRLSNFKFGSAGYALECNDVMIKDPDDEGVGEVYAKGTNVMQGYYNDPEATAEAFDGDWYKTGDYGYMDEDGFLYLRGRKKNLIVLSNGKNVSPEELEDKLMSIDYIKEVVVYEENGAITAEFFLDTVTYPDAESRIKGDVRALNKTMPAFKQISKIKTRDKEFPKTTTLKIKRKYK
ncbi:MAG: AMP-binding protein [Clostridiaceae bacterium]|nr:AMP-binding protein [Clostridiaceae bacterium]MDY5888748.1 AMP-binding protein [Oscillospiraceae bacterium]